MRTADLAALSPDDRDLPATKESVSAIDAEINRLQARIERLEQARANIKRRMKAA